MSLIGNLTIIDLVTQVGVPNAEMTALGHSRVSTAVMSCFP